MSSVRVDVQWSPVAADQFLTWGSDLQLYQVQDVTPTEIVQLPRLRLGPKTAASLLSTNNDLQFIKCVSWCPGQETDPTNQLLAVGQANGKVALTTFSKVPDARGIKGREFIPKHSRPVNSLAWSTQEPQLLAAGLDKVRTDHSVIVCDVTRTSQPPTYAFDQRNSSAGDVMKPMIEFGLAETTHSVAFSLHANRTLITGMNNKHIKVFDLREGKLCATANTKAVYGICTDVHNEHRLASFVENQVSIWDLRSLERPVLYLDATKTITKLAWCPSRVGLLASLCRDSSSVRIYDILHYTHGGEDQEPAVITRSINTDSSTYISAFSWHPTHENRIITASYTGKLVDYNVHERITLNWSATSALLWTNGKKTLQQIDCQHPVYSHFDDISTAIMTRAQKKYGLHVNNLATNGEVTDDMSLRNLWTWLDAARSLVIAGNFKLPGGMPYRYQGVWSLMAIKEESLSSDIINKSWVGLEGQKPHFAKVFRCEERSRALELCSWGFESETVLNSFLSQLEAAGYHTRAAAVAVFNQRLKQAILILERGASSKKLPALNSTAMALSGFTEERKGLWRETCMSLRSQLTDPYLRAMFAFLTDDADSYEPVLGETEMAIEDRVAFACTYLSDIRLMEYLEKLNTQLTEEGNLDGILLTGLCSEGIDLLQRYVDLTGDVQTVALVTIHTLQHAFTKDSRLSHWVHCYRNLLDSLGLWNERAQLDVIMNDNKHAERPPQHIYLTCNFCKKGISAYIQTPGRPRNPYARFGTGSANKSKMQACPNCRKPLPRCSLCLVHMGTPSGWGSSVPKNSSGEEGVDGAPNTPTSNTTVSKRKLSNFTSWFTWCQTCRHGGHAHHLMEWFKEHTECPVTSCKCKCMSLDTVSKVASSSVSLMTK
ncbi:GATOR complex protein MIOS-A-like [Homarus americanus]|uniref:GATOR complex protein MIOS-A-like n=1 Tax=Homarus americanus TaxID=6706 RepID=UPI001C439169|nr:GATOR complex protein MIOS-A-like [Homarus americanus]XP_042242960.1 GATOR complex protein MIOS-A-like [Homarus americanus]